MQPTGNEFKALEILHRALLLGVAVLAVVGVFVVIKGSALHTSPSLDKPLQVAALLLSVGATAAGFLLFNKKIKAIPVTDTAPGRLAAYRAAAIQRWALIEAPIVFSLVSFLLTGNYAFLALGIALMLVLLVTRPARQIIIYLLQLNEKEVRELEGSSE